MKPNDKRKYIRIPGFLEGTFETDAGMQGLIMLTNFTREGLGVALNRSTPLGAHAAIEAWLPGSIVPVFARGTVMWIKPGEQSWAYPFAAGIRLTEIARADVYRVLDYVFECWRSGQQTLA